MNKISSQIHDQITQIENMKTETPITFLCIYKSMVTTYLLIMAYKFSVFYIKVCNWFQCLMFAYKHIGDG